MNKEIIVRINLILNPFSMRNMIISVVFVWGIIISTACFGQTKEDSIVIRNELFYSSQVHNHPQSIEGLFDTLRIKKKVYAFRRTPLASKKGYTSILFNDVTIIGPHPRFFKGYRISWIVQNDSLFIDKIHPFNFSENLNDENGISIQPYSENEIRDRFEIFTGCKYKNERLFVDWINGDFPILVINPNAQPVESWMIDDEHFLSPPLRVSVKNGILGKIKKDDVVIKLLKKKEH